MKDVIDFLHEQNVYTETKKLDGKFIRNKTTASGYMTDWQADLAIVSKISGENDGYQYLLCCIDQLSRYAWVVPLKDKTAAECSKAFKIILDDGYRPFRLYTDMGSEFMASFKNLMKKHDIMHIMTTNTETKCAMVERYIRTLKHRLWKAFYHQKTYRYVEILPQIVDAINNTHHTTIKCTPASVNRTNASELRAMLYPRKVTTVKFKYKVGDMVRISYLRGVFVKGYTGTFTKELFVVVKCIPRTPPVYILKDLDDEIVKGTFYEHEMVKVLNHDGVYDIEEKIATRTRKGIKQVLIKWLGYPKKFNQWIDAKNVE